MKQIQSRREKAGWLDDDLAKKSGVHVVTIREIERGVDRRVQGRVRKSLAKALRCTPADLFTSEGIPR